MANYLEEKAKLQYEQEKMSYDDIKKAMENTNEFIMELDNLKPQKHLWIDRGLKMTCENAGHPMHEAWKRRKATVWGIVMTSPKSRGHKSLPDSKIVTNNRGSHP